MNIDHLLDGIMFRSPGGCEELLAARLRGDFYLSHCQHCLRRIFPDGIIYRRTTSNE